MEPEPGLGEVALVHDLERGVVRLEDGCVPPTVIAFCPDLVDRVREGQCRWSTVEVDGRAEVVVMHIVPVPLRYRLTGEKDLTGGLVAVRVDEEGRLWTDR